MDNVENKQEEPSIPANKPAAASETTETENSDPADPAQEDYTYFNVMPHGKGSGEVISPTVHIQDIRNSGNTLGTSLTSQISTYRYYLLGLLVVALGAAAYFLIPVFFTPGMGDNILVNNNQSENIPEEEPEESEIPKDWLVKYFNVESCVQENVCGSLADPDLDGFQNLEEFKGATDPNNNDSDKDGLSDGDEVKIFGSDPLNSRTAGDAQYTDADFIKGGYDFKAKDQLLTKEQIEEIGKKMKSSGLHQPTVTTLGAVLESLYNFKPEAETQETETEEEEKEEIKTIAIALQKYYENQSVYPNTGNFKEMAAEIKPYNRVATNPVDPIDKDPYVYIYKAENNGADFVLTYYSETQNQAIKLRAKDAQKFKESEEAKINDDRRMSDLQLIQSALQVYSNAHVAGNQEYVFPLEEKYKTELVPAYMTSIPKDPQTGKDYEYKVSERFDSFTLKAVLSNPPAGTTGYLCNQEECRNY